MRFALFILFYLCLYFLEFNCRFLCFKTCFNCNPIYLYLHKLLFSRLKHSIRQMACPPLPILTWPVTLYQGRMNLDNRKLRRGKKIKKTHESLSFSVFAFTLLFLQKREFN